MSNAKTKFLHYKGKPLVRCGSEIYYGDPAEPFIAMLQVMTEQTVEDVKMPDKILINILSTDESLPLPQRMIKRTEKNGLYSALSIASIWLERQLTDSKSKE